MAHDVNQSETDIAAQVRSALVHRISSERYDLWIPESTQWHFDAGRLSLAFESDFHSQLARRMLADDLSEVALSVCGQPVDLHFCMLSATTNAVPANAAAAPKTRTQTAPVAQVVNADKEPRLALPQGDANAPNPSLDRRADSNALDSWNAFVSGSSNQLAWATAKLVINEPGRMSPVLIHGPCGSGKSLLADAIAKQLRGARRMRRVVHMTSEQFTNDFTDGLRGGGLPLFRRKYRDVEALILEDIQFFVGKKSTLSEIKHTLDNLIRSGKQVVFTADRSLNELEQLGSDFVGRIRGGLTAPIFPLDEQTRFEILKRQTMHSGVNASDEVLHGIAERTSGDGRVLSGIAKRLSAVAYMQDSELDWESCWSAIHDLIQATQPVVRIVDIERVVCDIFGLETDSLQSQSKIRRVSQPRMLAMFLARKYTPAAYKEIGDYFGKRRHSTVISAEKTVEAWLVEDAEVNVGRGLSVRDAIRHVESQLQVG